MRLVSFRDGHDSAAGLLVGDLVHEVGATMAELLEDFPNSLVTLSTREITADPGRRHHLTDLELMPPVPAPSKVIGIGMNYRDHCRELGQDPPTKPLVFAKFPSSLAAPGAPLSWPLGLTDQVDWEVELAIVIGQRAYGVRELDARSYIAGFAVANDVSARDLQFGDGQFTRGKSLNGFCPMGPALVTSDEVPQAGGLDLWLEVNGERLQTSNTRQLVFGIEELVSFLSLNFTLFPGDIILTGTPAGVGTFRKPPRYLKAGDLMVASVVGLGRLETPVVGPVATESTGN
jgi:2-keto-4-pentenoate hydratase/2-oxohepta-3-ene-1,7-dioic acid hydratase in catechol pathway